MSRATNASTNSDTATWHAMSAGDVVKRLATNSEKGLDAEEASVRLQKHGPNRLPEGKKRGPFMRFLAQFNNVLVYVLLAAGFTKLMLNLWVDAAIIFGVVVLNALLGFIQEGKAEKALDSIRNMLSAEARIVRSGDGVAELFDLAQQWGLKRTYLGEQLIDATELGLAARGDDDACGAAGGDHRARKRHVLAISDRRVACDRLGILLRRNLVAGLEEYHVPRNKPFGRN